MKTIYLFFFLIFISAGCYNSCNGHGTCDTSNLCVCHRQLGLGLNNNDENMPMFGGADCSERQCPTGEAFAPFYGLEGAIDVGSPVTWKAETKSDPRLLEEDDFTGILEDGDLNITDVEIPIPAFKPKPNAPSLGGVLKCGKGENEVFIDVVTQYQINGTWYIASDDPIPEGSECTVMYVRSDLSLFQTIHFTGNGWDTHRFLLNRIGFFSGNYTVSAACVNDTVTNIIRQENIKLIMGYETVSFEYHKTKKPAYCFLLSVGFINGKVINIEMLSAEISSLISKDANHYYYGPSPLNTVVKATKPVNDGNNEEKRILYPLNDQTGKTIANVFQFSIPSSRENEFSRYFVLGATVVLFITGKNGQSYNRFIKSETLECSKFYKEYPGTSSEGSPTYNTVDYTPKPGYSCFVIFVNEDITLKDDQKLLIKFTSTGGVHPTAECSGAGRCNRESGQCECLPGYTGDACQRVDCPNKCSNHGKCVNASQAVGEEKFPESVPKKQFGIENVVFGCICDPGFRGGDCSLLECPSAEDPRGATNLKESKEPEKESEFRDCSGRGICDYTSGNCKCFEGYGGTGCEVSIAEI